MKKKRAESGWATAHLSHDIMDCIVTQGWGGWPGHRGLGHDTARRPVIRLRQWPTIRSACAQGVRQGVRQGARVWPGQGEASRYKTLCRGLGATLCHDTVQPRAATRRSAPYNTAQGSCDTRSSTRDTVRGRSEGRDTIFVS